MVCTCMCILGRVFYLMQDIEEISGPIFPDITNPIEIIPPMDDDYDTPEPLLTTEPLPPQGEETLDAIFDAEIPDADYHELGIRFLGVDADTERTLETTTEYNVGDRRMFNVSNVDTDEQFTIEAALVYKTEHVYMWVEEGTNANQEDIEAAADLFEQHTYPTDREFFGSEWTPGVDNDPHLSILHANNLGNTVAGYFSSPDQYVKAVRPDSNEMEMFYIHLANVNVGDDFYNGVLAHEFQHMIHWYNDRNEETWLNEGCSELAMALNDRLYEPGYYDVGGSDTSYIYKTDTQLNTWPEGTAGSAAANYGGAYLFMEYFLDQFGEEATKALVAHPENGMESVDATCQELNIPLAHTDIFANWSIANLLDDPILDEGQYGYNEINPYDPRMDESYRARDYPITHSSSVHQYGVDYIELEGRESLNFSFTGSTQVGLINTEAYSGKYLWWSNRADESDSRLTRIVDLANVDEATLDFWAWYHIEEDWDYGYVAVGTTENGTIPDDLDDPEIKWDILDDNGVGCKDTNPNGNNYGCGLTGKSDGWVNLQADLTSYVGQEIALRFEYITDAAVNQPGMGLDDIRIIADDAVLFTDDIETESDAWIAEGFVRHANVMPQEWIVQLVTFGNQTEIQQLLMIDGTEGQWTIPMGENGVDRAVITISAIAPVTTEMAAYEYTLSPQE